MNAFYFKRFLPKGGLPARPSLPVVLEAAWWAVTGLLLILLAVDGFLFYRYVFTAAVREDTAPVTEPFRVETAIIKKAAAAAEAKRAQFLAAPPSPPGLRNPFR